MQKYLFWTRTAEKKHFLVEYVLKRPPLIFQIKVCFLINFFFKTRCLYLKSGVKKLKYVFMQKYLFWTLTAEKKHFLVEYVLKRPPLIFQIKVCFLINFFFKTRCLYLKSGVKKLKYGFSAPKET